MEGRTSYDFQVGLSPLGGDIAPAPTFQVTAERSDNWKIDLSQSPVADSLQSLIGQNDPYSDDEWGRVLKSGLAAEKTFELGGPYWLTLAGSGYYYWGENVADNYSVDGSIGVGRTDSLTAGRLSWGLFFQAEHFHRNADYYTYGHGGYFSPQYWFMAGPFARFHSTPGRDYWFDGTVSVGYMHYRTHDRSPHYHRVDADAASLNPAARVDYLGNYPGTEESQLGVDVELAGLKLIAPHLAVGGRAGVNTSANHTRWHAGLIIQVYFAPRQTLCRSADSNGN
jgi:hypothetical protein